MAWKCYILTVCLGEVEKGESCLKNECATQPCRWTNGAGENHNLLQDDS